MIHFVGVDHRAAQSGAASIQVLKSARSQEWGTLSSDSGHIGAVGTARAGRHTFTAAVVQDFSRESRRSRSLQVDDAASRRVRHSVGATRCIKLVKK